MRKIAYLILTAVSIYLCIMYDGAAPFYLLGFLILLALVLYGSSWYLRAHLRVHLNVHPRCGKRAGVSGRDLGGKHRDPSDAEDPADLAA